MQEIKNKWENMLFCSRYGLDLQTYTLSIDGIFVGTNTFVLPVIKINPFLPSLWWIFESIY